MTEIEKPKFPKPIIVALNTEPDIAQRLQENGYNVNEGSFGIPYRVPKEAPDLPEILDNSFLPPNFTESEIVIVDLTPPEILATPDGQVLLDNEGNPIRTKTPFGVLDPRPFTMLREKNKLDRILEHGGLFIVFAQPKSPYELHILDGRRYLPPFELTDWEFLSILADGNFTAEADQGSEIVVLPQQGPIAGVFKKHLTKATFSTQVHMWSYNNKNWLPLAKNKFGQTVAGVYFGGNADEQKSGMIMVLPHPVDKAGLILDLMQDVLPNIAPHHFPYIEKVLWVNQDIYQPASVQKLTQDIQHIQVEANRKIEQISAKIVEVRESFRYLADLTTETDELLVSSVKQTLKVLGFKKVVNYDEELQERGDTTMREDLHIRDKSPWILVEIKGIKGTSKEGEALQVTKYLFPRAQELGRTDLHGLTIINHQRHIPPLHRIPQPFSEDVLTNAESSNLGLLTTWNLYRLIRRYLELNWTHEQIRDLFYRSGFIEPIPKHYQYVGKVEGYIEELNVVGITVEECEFRIGDRIAFEFPILCGEQEVQTLQLNNSDIELALKGQRVGIKTGFGKDVLKDGVRVFRVNMDSTS